MCIYGDVPWDKAKSNPLGLKSIPFIESVDNPTGLAYLVPNPVPVVHGYINGAVLELEMTTSDPLGLNFIAFAPLEGNVAGLAYLVPNPVPVVHGYKEK